jgi:Tfp pilus assembly protein PilO
MNPEKLKELAALLRRHLFSVIATVVTVLALLTSGIWWLGIQDLRDEHNDKSRQNEKMLNLLKTGPVLKSELAAVRDFTQRLEANLTVEDDLSDNDDYFRRMAARARVRLADFQQMSSATPEEGALYRRVPFNVRVTGTSAQVQSFLHAIETGPRLANLTAFSMVRLNPTSTDASLELGLELIGKK